MKKVALGFISTLVIIYIVPFIVYSIFSNMLGVEPPKDISPAQFLVSILIIKIGTAIAITMIYYYAKDIFYTKWIIYIVIILTMFVIGEVGQAIGPNYSWKEAIAGIISETVYVPLSVIVLRRLVK